MLNNDLRHPVEVARETATLAAVTGGRFELGLGAGHMKSEYDAVGVPFDPGGTRVSRLVESVEVIRALLGGESVDFDGAHYQVHAEAGALVAAPTEPVPLLFGGNGTRVLQLAGRVADIVGLAGITHNRDATEVAADALRCGRSRGADRSGARRRGRPVRRDRTQRPDSVRRAHR